jgi:iron-hydrogenase subunit gamma
VSNLQNILIRFSNGKRDSLIPILQEEQQRAGYLSRESIVLIGEHLGMSVSKIYGVASFYNQFKFHSPGKFHIQICRGTACHVKGSYNLLDNLQRELKIKPDETTKDCLFSLEVVACVGVCSLAPVIVMNGEFYANMDTKKVNELINECKTKGLSECTN